MRQPIIIEFKESSLGQKAVIIFLIIFNITAVFGIFYEINWMFHNPNFFVDIISHFKK